MRNWGSGRPDAAPALRGAGEEKRPLRGGTADGMPALASDGSTATAYGDRGTSCLAPEPVCMELRGPSPRARRPRRPHKEV